MDFLKDEGEAAYVEAPMFVICTQYVLNEIAN